MADVVIPAGKVSSGYVQLTADAVTTVTFAENIGSVTLMNRGPSDIWYTTDGSTPAVGDQGSAPLPAGWVDEDVPTTNTPSGDVVKLISGGTPQVIIKRGK